MLGTVSGLFAGDTNSCILTVMSLLPFPVVAYVVMTSQDKSSKFVRLFVIMERITGELLSLIYIIEVRII